MNRKLKGFSLAELLISLLIISIVLSAAIPTLTKKSSGSEQIWRWGTDNSSAYFGIGAQQAAIIGNDVIPEIKDSFKALDGNSDNIKFTNSGDKLVLLKQSPSSSEKSHLMNSHISFYTLTDNSASKTNDYTYAGRLSLDRHNIALGIGSLQSLDPTDDSFLGNNTALGHFTLFRNQKGTYNTAIGEYSLANNKYAKHNTAIGYNAGLALDKASTSEDTNTNAAMNTVIGSTALQTSEKGRANTAIGYASLYSHTNGTGSTAIGAMSLYNAYGTGNTALGANSCRDFTSGSYNMCIGLDAGNLFGENAGVTTDFRSQNKITETSGNLLFIGSMPNDGSAKSNYKITPVPLIFGRMQLDNGLDKYLGVNVRKFAVNSFNGAKNILEVDASAGADGYTLGNEFTGTLSLTTLQNAGGAKSIFNVKSLSSDKDQKVYLNANNESNNYVPLALNNGALSVSYNPDSGSYNTNISSGAKNIDLFNNRIYFAGTNAARKARIDFQADGTLIFASAKTDAMTASTSLTISGPNDSFTFNVAGVNRFQITGSTVLVSNPLNMQGYDISMTGLPYSKPTLKQDLVAMRNDIIAAKSDIRAKNIIGDNKYGLDVIKSLDVKNYTYKDDKTKTKHVGVIAQQLQKVYPDAVLKGDDGYLRVKREELFFALLNAVKELFNQLQDLTAKVVGLDKRINTLEQENAMLKKQNAEFEKRLERLEKKM